MTVLHNGKGNVIDEVNPLYTAEVGSFLQEQKTQANAAGGVLTFASTIKYIEIYNRDATNTGTFTVNGIAITVPPNVPYGPVGVGGVPSAQVTVTGSTSYIVTRYT